MILLNAISPLTKLTQWLCTLLFFIPFTLYANPILSNIEPLFRSKTINNIANHAYSTVTSPVSSLAVVSGETGATLVDYETARNIGNLNINGLAANSAVFVPTDTGEMVYVLAFSNFPGMDSSNGVYGFPIENGKIGERLSFLTVPGTVFPVNSLSISATEDGRHVYFVTLETDEGDGDKCTGKRWLNHIEVDPKQARISSIPMPEWKGYSGDAGDSGVAVAPDGQNAYLPHNRNFGKNFYRVTHPDSNNAEVSTFSPLSGNAVLVTNDNQSLIVFDYGDIDRYNLKDNQTISLYSQPEKHQSILQSGQIYDNGNKLVATLQDISGLEHFNAYLSQGISVPKQFVAQTGVNSLFPPNEVISIDLVSLKKKTLYKRTLFGAYPTSAAFSRDNRYLLVALWHEDKGISELVIYDTNSQLIPDSENIL